MAGNPPRESWEALQGKAQHERPIPETDTPEEMVMRALSAGPGRDLLDWLKREYIEKRNLPGASEAALRELEAQRALVDRLEKMKNAGKELTDRRLQARAKQ